MTQRLLSLDVSPAIRAVRITGEVTASFIRIDGIDWAALATQKQVLLDLQGFLLSNDQTERALAVAGILVTINHIQDVAVEDLGIPAGVVFQPGDTKHL